MSGKLDAFNAFELPLRKDNEALILSNAIQDSKNREYFIRKVSYFDFRIPEFKTLAWAIKHVVDNKIEVTLDSVLIHAPKSPERHLIPDTMLIDIISNYRVVSNSDFEKYVKELKLDSIKSKILDSTFGHLYKICLDPAADLGEVEKRVDYLKNIIKTGYSSSILEFKSMDEVIADYKENFGKKANFRTTGFKQIDAEMNEGLRGGAITLIAARPHEGKSSLTLSMMKNLANKKIHTAQFALEMNNISLTTKLMSFNTQLPMSDLTKDIEKLAEHNKALYDYEMVRLANNKYLWLNDTPSQSIATIREQTMMLQDHLQTEYIVIPIDLFGKIKEFAGSDNFARDYEKELNRVQIMVRELGVHYILVAQMNRDSANNKKKGRLQRPKMSNLKNAGAFEEVADNIFAIHRPYYDSERALRDELKRKGLFQNEEDDDSDEDDDLQKFLAEVILLKQRMGANNKIINFFMDPQTTRFQPWDALDQETLNKMKLAELNQEDDD